MIENEETNNTEENKNNIITQNENNEEIIYRIDKDKTRKFNRKTYTEDININTRDILILNSKSSERNKRIINKKLDKDKKNVKNNDKKVTTINFCNIIYSIIFPCCYNCTREDKNSKYCCASCKLGWRKFFFRTQKNFFFNKIISYCTCCRCIECCSCCPSCQKCCCECCEKLELKESYEEEEIFCYIYQTQRKCSWFCDLFFKNNLLTLIVYNIIIEIGIIGFEKKLNENLETKEISKNFKTLSAYLGIFLSFVIFYLMDFIQLKLVRSKYTKYVVIVFVIFYYIWNIILSGLSAFGKKKLKNVIDDWFILLPIAYSKYINFILIDKLVNILDEENIDILSNSLIITCFFFIYDIIIFLITDILDCKSENLILAQFIISIFIFISTFILLGLDNIDV